ncbi:MAG: glycerol-3-phosphate 1-O-acyltransferase PlsY [Bacteroidia bacterium]
MVNWTEITFILVAYLVGSFPTAVWIGKLFYNVDVREFGSGNAGATNTFRVLGKKAGVPVLVLDVLKGFLAVMLAYFSRFTQGTEPFVNFQLVLGVASLLGHIFPVFAGFRGGKGVATLLGVVLAVQPEAAAYAMIVFIVVLLVFRYVSLASMTAGLIYPILVIGIFKTEFISLLTFSILVSVMLIITHKRNIDRLLKKQEAKVKLFSSAKES